MAFTLATIKNELAQTRPTFDQMELSHTSFAKEMEFAMQAFTKTPALLNCRPDTVKNCLVNVALAGTTLSPVMKFAHLVPRKGECCLDMSYMGLIKIITDTGSAKSIKAKPVFENEPFEIELGTNGFVKHGICNDGKVGKRIGAYSIAVLSDGSNHVEWMYEYQLMAIKARAQKTGGAVWNTDEDEMCRKTVVKRHWKYLPKSERAILAAQAIAFDDEHNGIDFQKEAVMGNSAEVLDTPYEDITDEGIPQLLIDQIKAANTKKQTKALFESNPNLHDNEAFKNILKKRNTEIELIKMQNEQQDGSQQTEVPLINGIPKVIVDTLEGCKTKKEANDVFNGHPELHKTDAFKQLIKDTHAKIDLAKQPTT